MALYHLAMEDWEPDTFRLQIIHQSPLPDGLARLLPKLSAELQEITPAANLNLEVIDLRNLSDSEKLGIPRLQQIRFWPAAILYPPESWLDAEPLVFGASETTIQRILHSPIRQRISDELITHTAVVWCLVESGDATADKMALKLLKDSIATAQDKSASALRFSIEQIRRDDPAEQTFLKILMGPNRRPLTGPVLVPIFGRGRTLGPIPASIASEARLVDTCREITTALPTNFHDTLPGYDLLFSANWQANLSRPVSTTSTQVEPEATRPPSAGTPADTQEPPSISRGFITFLVGGGVLLLGIFAIFSLKFRT